MKISFPLLGTDQIECRVGTINEKGLTLLLYKTARTDMEILDETVGPTNWQRDHKEVKANMYAGLGIWDSDKGQWIWKWDCGTESNTEAEKGEASDSFKRAGFNFGIGRELYTAPFIWIPAKSYKATTNKQGKPATFDRFSVAKITYTPDKKIDGLAIKNESTQKIVFLQKPTDDALLEKSQEVREKLTNDNTNN